MAALGVENLDLAVFVDVVAARIGSSQAEQLDVEIELVDKKDGCIKVVLAP